MSTLSSQNEDSRRMESEEKNVVCSMREGVGTRLRGVSETQLIRRRLIGSSSKLPFFAECG